MYKRQVQSERGQLRFLAQQLPQAEAILFDDNAEPNALLSEQPPSFDALLMSAEEGAAWSIRFPRYTLVTPKPVLLAPFGYAVAPGDDKLLTFLDAWLQNARGAGSIDRLYRWMLGDRFHPPTALVYRPGRARLARLRGALKKFEVPVRGKDVPPFSSA